MNTLVNDIFSIETGQVTLLLPRKINGGRLSELLERIPYVSENVKSVSYSDQGHCAIINVESSEADQMDLLRSDLQELVEALLASKIAAQKTLKTRVRPSGLVSKKHVDDSMVYYNSADLKLIAGVDKLLVDIAIRHGASIREYGSIYSAEIMARNGYHKNFPQNVYGVTQISHNYALIKEIRESSSSTIPPGMFHSQGAFLQPCVCYHCYAEIQDSIQSNVLYTLKGRCFRHEIEWRLNNFRRNEFTMREIVFMGSPEYVESKRLTIMEDVWALFGALGLYGQIVTARDPFFHYDDMKTKGAVQLMADAKYELEFISEAGHSSSIASFNNCQDTLCAKFGITDFDSNVLHSGCVAFGIDRWRAALFEQYGGDCEVWPDLLNTSNNH